MCAAQRTRKSSLRVDSSPTRSGEPLVVRVPSGLGAQDGDGVVGHRLPVEEEVAGSLVQEDEPGDVHGADGVVEQRRVERGAEPVGGEHVEAAVAHVGGLVGHGVDDPLHHRPDPFLFRLPPWRTASC